MSQRSDQTWAPSSGYPRSSRLKKLATGTLFTLFVLLLLMPGQAHATHFRFGLVTATRLSETPTTVTYRLNVSLSWRLGTAPSSVPFSVTGGNTGSLSVAMTTVTDPSGSYDNSTGTASITLNKTSTLTRVEFSGFTKLTTIANNANSNWDVYIVLNTNAPGSSPVSTLPAIINMPAGVTATTYAIPASDPDPGTTLTYSTPAFTGILAAEGEPSGFSVNSSTGMMTFNTMSTVAGQQYNALVTVTDNDGNQIMLDFLINIVSTSAPPQFDYSVTPVNGAVYNILVGQTLTFPVSATNPGSGTTVSMSVSGLPSYITTSNFSPAFPATGNPSTTNFSWTPAAPQLGSSVILNFIATNNLGIQTSSSVGINVVAEPAPVYMSSTPAEGSIRSILAGNSFSDTITSQSSIGSNVSIAYAFIPSGSATTPAVPTTGSNPGQTIFTWTPLASDFGQHHLTFESIISATPTIFSTLHYDLIVDNLPVFSSTPVTTATGCAAYTYSVTATDADIPYGDTVDIVQDGLFPSWLTITKTGNGTAVLSGTPTNADTGTYVISLAAEDLYHHNYSKIGQSYTLVVTANTITGAPGVCIGSSTTLASALTGGIWSSSNTDASVDAATGVVTGMTVGGSTITYDLSGCTTTAGVAVNPLPTVSAITGTDTACMGSTVTLTNTTPGGAWSSSDPTVVTIGATSGDYTGLIPGTSGITYAVTDALGCTNSAGTTVTIDPVYAIISSAGINGTMSPSGTTNICLGNNATYTITANTGFHILDVIIDGSSAGALGTYTFSSVNAAHSINATFAPDCVGPTITCAGDMTVNADAGVCTANVTYASATATGTTPVIVYSQASGTTFPAGTTLVIATATNSCGTDNCSFNVTVVDNQNPTITAPGTVTVNADAGACSASVVSLGTPVTADNCGVATVTNDGVAPYTVGTTLVTWTVTDNSGNVSTATQNVVVVDNQNPVITAPSDVTVSADAGYCSAASVALGTPVASDNCAVATVTNDGVPPYAVGTTVVTWTVTDAHGNTTTATQNVTVIDDQDPTITAPQDITLTGYCSPMTVSLGTPVTGDNCGVASVTNDAPALFPVGTTIVTWTVTDIHGNTATATQTVVVSGSITMTGTVSNVPCNGGSTGSITTTMTGGTPAFTYAWSNGATTSGISGIPAGTYTVTVTDAHDCKAGGIYTVTQPTALSLAGAVKANVTCYGASNGTITTNVTGGTSAYSYTWSTGSTSANLTALAPGTYSVTVTDAHSCVVSSSYTITQPSAILAASVTTTNAACYGSTGTISVAVSGGTSPYSYLWSNGATTSAITTTAGTYTVVITDAGGCSITSTNTITQPNTAFVFETDIDNVNCHGGYDGHIDADVTGGTWPYAYSWSTGGKGFSFYDDLFYAPAGTYTVTVVDARGCTISATYTITEPPVLALTGTTTNVSCYGANNGSINTTVTGGTAPYFYSWSNGSHSADPTGLYPGIYYLVVTDAHGCTTSASYIVTQPSAISLTAVTANLNCHGDGSGAINTTVSGGRAPYTYHWSNGATTADLTGIAAGTYNVTITDANGCTRSSSYTITQPSAISLTAVVTRPNNCDSKSGKINTTVTGGVAPYSYVWSNGKTSADLTKLSAGTYSVTVTDAHGCTVTATWTVTCGGSKSSDPDNGGGEEAIVGADKIKVFPNPTDGMFSVEVPVAFKTADIQVSDITGRIIDRRTITDNSGEAIQFSLNNMVQGLYFVKVKAGDQLFVDKIIKR